MFANVPHHHHTYKFPHISRYVDESSFKDFSELAVGGVVQDYQKYGPLHGDSRQRLQKPQLHGQPIFKARCKTSKGDQLDPRGLQGNVSEHMLRRKTPTGTLAAGYDGQQVEWTGRPHATKHFLLPISTTTTVCAVTCESLSITESAIHPRQMRSRDPQAIIQEQCHLLNIASAENMGHRDAIMSGDLRSKLPQPDSLDSVLNQGTWSNPFGGLAWEQRNPAVLQPMWPPSLGFTAMNDPYEYGHRWVGDPYSLHRLASFQAPHHYAQPMETRTLGDYNLGRQEFEPREANFQGNPNQESFNGSARPEFGRGCLDQDGNRNETFFQHELSQPQHQRLSQAYRANPCSTKFVPDRYASHRNWPPEPEDFRNIELQRGSNFLAGIPTDRSKFRENVLMWAHRIYGRLITSTAQSHRSSRSSHRCDRRLASCLVLKPPTISYINSVEDPSSVGYDYEAFRKRGKHTQDIQNYTNVYEARWQPSRTMNNTLGDFNMLARGQLGHKARQGRVFWYQQQEIDGQDSSPKMISSMIAETSPVSVRESWMFQHENSTVNAAAAAIQLLDRLCQESGWKWTQGMLLGGCLAYGLNDYDKAMNRYLKILSDDSK